MAKHRLKSCFLSVEKRSRMKSTEETEKEKEEKEG
jgi:hypothetical protein